LPVSLGAPRPVLGLGGKQPVEFGRRALERAPADVGETGRHLGSAKGASISALSRAISAGAPRRCRSLRFAPESGTVSVQHHVRCSPPCSIPVSEGSASPMRRERWPRAAIAATRAGLT
jgi:hypothetical protein